MKFESSHICTTGKEIEVGKQYQYKEDGWICDVTILEDTSDDEKIEFKLRIDKKLDWPEGMTDDFTVSAARGPGAYNGMWRLWNLGEYVRFPVEQKATTP